MCPLIAVFLSRCAAKFSVIEGFFTCGGSLPDRGTAVLMVHPSENHESHPVQAIQASGQIFLAITGKVFLPTHTLDLFGFFIEATSRLC